MCYGEVTSLSINIISDFEGHKNYFTLAGTKKIRWYNLYDTNII